MQKSLIHGLNEKDMQAVVNTYMLKDYYYPTLFPLVFNPTLSWKSLTGDEGVPVAADIVSYDATNPLKTREVVGKASGDIPKISMQFNLKESEINAYNELRHYAEQGNSSAAKRLLDFVYGDMEKCFKGVNARLEWLALTGASTGGFALTKDTNNGVVTEFDVDFLVPSARKVFIATANRRWSVANAATALPVDDIRGWVETMEAAGKKVNTIFMSKAQFYVLAQIEQIQKFSASFAINVTGLQRRPNLVSVNEMLVSEGLPEIKIIDSLVTIEKSNGTRTTVNPWKTGNIVLAPGTVLGNTQYGPSAYETNKPAEMMQVKRSHVLLQKWSKPEPLTESTAGVANAIPVLGQSQNVMIVNTTAASFAA